MVGVYWLFVVVPVVGLVVVGVSWCVGFFGPVTWRLIVLSLLVCVGFSEPVTRWLFDLLLGLVVCWVLWVRHEAVSDVVIVWRSSGVLPACVPRSGVECNFYFLFCDVWI